MKLTSLIAGIAIIITGIGVVVVNAHLNNDIADMQTQVDMTGHAVAEFSDIITGMQGAVKTLGAAGTEVPTSVALFETSLASAISSSATSMTLVSGTDQTGTALASSTYGFIIDEGTASQEMVIADCTSTACTNIIRGVSPLTGTTTVTALKKAHRRGASVKVTDGPQLMILSRLINGNGFFPNALRYLDLSSTTISGLSDFTIVNKQYADFVGTTGCANSSETARGCSELATGLEAASSTQTGSTGARVVIPGSLATDTPNAATNGSRVLMSDITGYLKHGWLNLTEAFTWTGAQTFNSTSMFNATTTIAASSTQGNPLKLNLISYAFPPTQGASSTILATNGSGNLAWASPPRIVLVSDGTTYSNNNGTLTIVKSVTVPANTLAANDNIHIVAHIAKTTGSTNQCRGSVQFGTGSATSTIMSSAEAFGAGTGGGMFEMWISNRNSQASQQINGFVPLSSGATPQTMTATGTVATVNMANASYLGFFVADTAGGSDTCSYTGIFVEATKVNN